MSSMMFYKNLVPLDKKKNKDLKLQRQSNYDFAKEANAVTVAGFEFFEASRSYPIFFLKNKEGVYIPIAILSFRQKGHDLGDDWQGVYVPAYVRRYPFMLSSDGIVMFDEDAPHMQEAEGEALFDEEGEATKLLTEVVDFLKMADQGYRLTEEYCKALSEKELFRQFDGKVAFPQGNVNLGEVYVIDEKKVHETLNEAEVYEWFNKGWLAWTHAHLHSIGSLGEVAKRAVANTEQVPAAPEDAESEA